MRCISFGNNLLGNIHDKHLDYNFLLPLCLIEHLQLYESFDLFNLLINLVLYQFQMEYKKGKILLNICLNIKLLIHG